MLTRWDYQGKRLRRIFLTRALSGQLLSWWKPEILTNYMHFSCLVRGRQPRLNSHCQRAVVSGNGLSRVRGRGTWWHIFTHVTLRTLPKERAWIIWWGWGWGGHTTCPASLQTGRICTVHPGISPLLNTVLCAAHCVRHVQSKAQTFFILIFFNRRYRVFFSICTFYSS